MEGIPAVTDRDMSAVLLTGVLNSADLFSDTVSTDSVSVAMLALAVGVTLSVCEMLINLLTDSFKLVVLVVKTSASNLF